MVICLPRSTILQSVALPCLPTVRDGPCRGCVLGTVRRSLWFARYSAAHWRIRKCKCRNSGLGQGCVTWKVLGVVTIERVFLKYRCQEFEALKIAISSGMKITTVSTEAPACLSRRGHTSILWAPDRMDSLRSRFWPVRVGLFEILQTATDTRQLSAACCLDIA